MVAGHGGSVAVIDVSWRRRLESETEQCEAERVIRTEGVTVVVGHGGFAESEGLA